MEPITVILILAFWFFGRPKPDEVKKGMVYGMPGPVVRPVIRAEEKVPDDSEYLAQVDSLISTTPQAERLWQITAGGPTASAMAVAVLTQYNANTPTNRLDLIKCMTQIPWNQTRYTAAHPAASWGTLYDVNGQNLSAAWLPRHAPAAQLLAARESPPRTINEAGAGQGGYYALLWIPKITIVAGGLVCMPLEQGPPSWLLNAIGGS
jgi:hypothetical protein